MATFLIVQGMDNVEIDENFDKVRHRINQAVTGADKSGEELDAKKAAQPLHDLTFKTSDGGRIAVNPEKVIGVGSTAAKDAEDDDSTRDEE
jgi:hypothetical protein